MPRQANKLEETIREYLKQEQEMKHHLTALGEIKNQLARNEVRIAYLYCIKEGPSNPPRS